MCRRGFTPSDRKSRQGSQVTCEEGLEMGRRCLVKGGELIVVRRLLLALQAGGEQKQLSVKPPVCDQGRDQKLDAAETSSQEKQFQPGTQTLLEHHRS